VRQDLGVDRPDEGARRDVQIPLIEGRATFTIVISSRIMNCEQRAATSVQRWRLALISRLSRYQMT
jgi:hypothetical protein